MNLLVDMMFEKYVSSVEDLMDNDTDSIMIQMMDKVKESVAEVKSDSAYKVFTNRMKNGVRDIRSEIKEKGMDPSKIKFISSKYARGQEDDDYKDLTELKLYISFNTGKDTDTMQLVADKCLHHDGNWFLGDRIRLINGSLDIAEVCQCVLDENRQGCDQLKKELETYLENMSDDELDNFNEEVMRCIEESAAKNYKEEEAYPDESYVFSKEEIKEAKANLSLQIENYCDCGAYIYSETLPEGCEEQILEIQEFLWSLEGREQDLYYTIIEECVVD